ncbi:hypothetical protein Salat_1425300 [Sesamum alatum]|uniref:Zinc knuckle CX2CX4HX4C domain-containing protein n=1 Tax=Sesamum alatum TaxID=300844 RepID=A0AAE1YAT8_9LAMI|nr:hypothetical protein Salat_1425300 [Sesamum alatum]
MPLKHALRLRSKHGAEVVVRFFYERLPNFCYIYGTLGHISQYCSLRFQDGFIDPGLQTSYGAWLRASGPMRRLGSVSDTVHPTYVLRPPSPSGQEGRLVVVSIILRISGVMRMAYGGPMRWLVIT